MHELFLDLFEDLELFVARTREIGTLPNMIRIDHHHVIEADADATAQNIAAVAPEADRHAPSDPDAVSARRCEPDRDPRRVEARILGPGDGGREHRKTHPEERHASSPGMAPAAESRPGDVSDHLNSTLAGRGMRNQR